MPALTFPDPGTPYTIDPWADPNGNEWLYNSTKDRWSPVVVTSGGGEGGATAFVQLTDKATANLPTINAPLASALGDKLAVTTAASTYATSAALTSGLATKQAAGSYPTGSGTSSGTNTGDETTATIKTKLSITTLSGSNTGDQDLSSYATTAVLALKVNAASPAMTGSGTFGSLTGTDVTAANVTVSTAFNGPGTGLSGTAASLSIGGNAATVTTINGRVSAGTNVTITGTGTAASPYIIAASVSGGGGGDALVANPLSQFASTTSAQLAGVVSDETGNGALVFANSPALVTPSLGTPASGNLANCTFPTLNQSTSGNAATVTTNANLTGHITSTGNAAVLGSFTTAHLNAALSDNDVATLAGAETLTNKTLVAPALGTPASGVGSNLTAINLPMIAMLSGPLVTDSGTTGRKAWFRVVRAFTLAATDVSFDCVTAPTGAAALADIEKNGTSIYTTRPTIDVSEISSSTGTVGTMTSSPASFAIGDIVGFFIDQIGSTVAGAGYSLTLNVQY